jgi:hypothetical protein
MPLYRKGPAEVLPSIHRCGVPLALLLGQISVRVALTHNRHLCLGGHVCLVTKAYLVVEEMME